MIHKRLKSKRSRRRGVSLVELVVSSILLAVVLAGVGEIMSLCVYTTIKQFNLSDVRIGLRRALEQIKQDVRGSYGFNTGECSPSTLSLIIPEYYLAPENNPLHADYNPIAPQNPLNGVPLAGGTVTYSLRRDAVNNNEFVLESTRTNSQGTTNQVVAKGIVGPFARDETDGLPDVFKYLIYQDGGAVPNTVEAVSAAAASGVAVDFEIKRPEQVEEVQDRYKSTIGVRGEAFRRLKFDESN